MFRRVLIKFIFLFFAILFFKESSSESLIFDLSDRFIEISKDKVKPDFTIFGFTDSESSLVLKIKGPNQKVILQNKKKIDIVNENKNPPKNEVNDNILIYYLNNNYYDKNLKKINLKEIKNFKKVILSVSPKISLENLFQIKSKIGNRNIKITQFDEIIIKNIFKNKE